MKFAPQLFFLLAVLLVLAGCQSTDHAQSSYGMLYVFQAERDAKRSSVIGIPPRIRFNWPKYDAETAAIHPDDCPRDFQTAWQAYRQEISREAQINPDPLTSEGPGVPDPSVLAAWDALKESGRRHGIIFSH